MVDWTEVYYWAQPYATFVSGIFFGIAWWVWADAVVYTAAVLGGAFKAVTLLPGIGATVALLMMSCVTRDDVTESGYGGQEAQCRSKMVLFISYLLSLAAVCGAVTLLVLQKQHDEDLWIGVSAIIQSCLIVASGVLAWLFHQSEGYMYIS